MNYICIHINMLSCFWAQLSRSWGKPVFYRCCLILPTSPCDLKQYLYSYIHLHRVNLFCCCWLHVRCIPPSPFDGTVLRKCVWSTRLDNKNSNNSRCRKRTATLVSCQPGFVRDYLTIHLTRAHRTEHHPYKTHQNTTNKAPCIPPFPAIIMNMDEYGIIRGKPTRTWMVSPGTHSPSTCPMCCTSYDSYRPTFPANNLHGPFAGDGHIICQRTAQLSYLTPSQNL